MNTFEIENVARQRIAERVRDAEEARQARAVRRHAAADAAGPVPPNRTFPWISIFRPAFPH